MPVFSPFPDVAIPDCDLWTFLLGRKARDFSDDKVIYRSLDPPRKYTFTHVEQLATRFGQGLQSLWDWQKDQVLALYAPNDIDLPPILLGTFWAGGIVTPANPAYSADELAFQLTNSGARALVTVQDCLETALKAAEMAGIPHDRVVLLGWPKEDTGRVKHWSDIRHASEESRHGRQEAEPERLAVLAYSSGTTGLPKGVMLTHRNIIANLCMLQGATGKWYSSARDKFLAILPFFHIYGLTALLLQTLHRGIELVVMPGFHLENFLRTIQEHRITFVYVAPPVLVRLAGDGMADKYDCSSLKMITSGAAPLSRELISAVHKRLNVSINQLYGLSEASPVTHGQPWDEWHDSIGSVGKLLPNMKCKYVSVEGKELGAGEVGELWMQGPNIFKGYWKNEAATENALTADGYFRTGDVGYQDERQNFYITDRFKELIKYNGFQVAPAELEGKLLEHELVSDVAVVGVYDQGLHSEVPRAYIVPTRRPATQAGPAEAEAEAEARARAIVDWMASQVANHKRLRGGVVFVHHIPKNASGKILRRMLKQQSERHVALGVTMRARL